MPSANLTKLAQNWLEHLRFPAQERQKSPYFPVVERIFALVNDDPETLWTLIDAIRRLDSSDFVLANLAAGPVEDLLAAHGDQFIDRIEELAARDPIFRKLLGAVWKNDIDDAVWERIRAVAGPAF